jgi:hypothetical protein
MLSDKLRRYHPVSAAEFADDETICLPSLNPYDSRILNTFEQLTNERLKWALAIAETCFEPGDAMVRAASIDASA